MVLPGGIHGCFKVLGVGEVDFEEWWRGMSEAVDVFEVVRDIVLGGIEHNGPAGVEHVLNGEVVEVDVVAGW